MLDTKAQAAVDPAAPLGRAGSSEAQLISGSGSVGRARPGRPDIKQDDRRLVPSCERRGVVECASREVREVDWAEDASDLDHVIDEDLPRVCQPNPIAAARSLREP